MKYIIGDIEEVIDYRSVLITRSLSALDRCLADVQPRIVFDIILISSVSIAQYYEHLSRLKKFTTDNTVIATDGSLGINFESIIYKIIPDCIALTFCTDCKLKYLGNHTLLYEKNIHKVELYLGSSIPPVYQKDNKYHERTFWFMMKRPSHPWFKFLAKLKKLQVKIMDTCSENPEVDFLGWLWLNLIITITGDCTAIILGDYVSNFEDVMKVSTVSYIYDELIYIALQTGCTGLHGYLNLHIDRFEALFLVVGFKPKLVTNQDSRPPYLKCCSPIFNFFNNLESYYLVMIMHCLKMADGLNIQSSALGVLYGDLSRRIEIIKGQDCSSLKVPILHVVNVTKKILNGPKYKRKKREEQTNDKFFLINNDDDFYHETYNFDNMDFHPEGFPKGYTGKSSDETNVEEGYIREYVFKNGDNKLINEINPGEEIFNRDFDVFRTMLNFDAVKRDSKEQLQIIKLYDNKIKIRDEIIEEYNLLDVLSKKEEEEKKKKKKIREATQLNKIDSAVDDDDDDDSISLDVDAQEIISNSSITQNFRILENSLKTNFYTEKLNIKFDKPRSTKWLKERSASLAPNKLRFHDPQIFKKVQGFDFDSFNTKHKKILKSLNGVGEDLIRGDRYKVTRQSQLFPSNFEAEIPRSCPSPNPKH